jgi:hypothetical protein
MKRVYGINLQKSIDSRIDQIQRDEDEYFVYLKYGWKLDLGTARDFQHCFGAANLKEIKENMKSVIPCTCPSCGGETK